MTQIDITAYSLEQLLDLQTRLPKEIDKRRHGAIADAKREATAIAARLGMSLDQLLTAGAGLPPKYRHPDNPTFEWSGKGRKPFWIKDLLDTGYTLDQLEIKEAA